MMKRTPGLAIAVSKSLRRLRTQAGLTQEDVAKRMGIQRPTVTRLEKGIMTPSLESVVQYVSATGHPFMTWAAMFVLDLQDPGP